MNKKPKSNLGGAIEPVTNQINSQSWSNNAGVSLGGAGVSTAVMLVLVQLIATKVTPLRVIALCFASFAIPMWLTLWQLSETTTLWKEKAIPFANKPFWLLFALGIFALAVLSIAVSIFLMLYDFSGWAAIVFAVSCISMLGLTMFHSHLMTEHMKAE